MGPMSVLAAACVMGSRADKLCENRHTYDEGQESVTTVTNTGSSTGNQTKTLGKLNDFTFSDIIYI